MRSAAMTDQAGADVAEQVDAVDLGSIALTGCGGSSPLVGTRRCRLGILEGPWPRLVRRLLCKEKIVGSNPTGSIFRHCCAGVVQR